LIPRLLGFNVLVLWFLVPAVPAAKLNPIKQLAIEGTVFMFISLPRGFDPLFGTLRANHA
jgi:hypothetical protein